MGRAADAIRDTTQIADNTGHSQGSNKPLALTRPSRAALLWFQAPARE